MHGNRAYPAYQPSISTEILENSPSLARKMNFKRANVQHCNFHAGANIKLMKSRVITKKYSSIGFINQNISELSNTTPNQMDNWQCGRRNRDKEARPATIKVERQVQLQTEATNASALDVSTSPKNKRKPQTNGNQKCLETTKRFKKNKTCQ